MIAIVTITGVRLRGPNSREHWAARMRRTRQQRTTARLHMLEQLGATRLRALAASRSLSITMVKRGGRVMDDDNLIAALKPWRDGIADALGIDDGDAKLRWSYEQRPGGRSITLQVLIAT